MAEYTTKLAEDEVLRLENLSIQFGGLKAVDDLSFAIKEKEIFGLIGPNGAGQRLTVLHSFINRVRGLFTSEIKMARLKILWVTPYIVLFVKVWFELFRMLSWLGNYLLLIMC